MRHYFGRKSQLLAVAAIAWASSVRADTAVNWTAAATGNWTDGTKWSTNPAYPNNGTPSGTNYNVSISAAGSPYTVSIGQNITVDGLTLNSSAATVQQTAGVMSINGILDLKAGSYQLAGGTLTNAFVQSEGGAFSVTGQISAPTLDGVTLETPVSIAQGTQANFQDGLTLSNTTLTLGSGTASSSPAQLAMGNSSLLGGTGTIIVNGNQYNTLGQSAGSGYVFTIGPNVTVATGTGGVILGPSNGYLVNQGVIQIGSSGTVVLNGSWSNQGTINQSGGILNLSGTFSTASLGNFIHTGGQIQLGGTLNNSGQTLNLSTTGSIFSTGSTITGGVISSSGNANFNYGYGATWTGVSLGSNLTLANSAAGNFNTDGLNLSGHTLTIGTGTTWSLTGPITGGGTVSVVASPVSGSSLTINGNGPGDTINPGVTVQSAGPNAPIIVIGTNGGTLMANNPRSSVTMQGNWSNLGTIALSNDGALILAGDFTPAAIGTITRADGSADTVTISGTVNNTGETLNLDQTGSLHLQGAINGGTITTSTHATLDVSSAQATLNGVTLGANLTVNTGTVLQISNGLMLNNTAITIESQPGEGGAVEFATGGTLGGTGSIVLDGAGGYGANIDETNGAVTIGPGILITTTAQGAGRFGTTGMTFQGTVQPAPGGAITLDSMTLTGTVNIPAGTSVTLNSINNSGTILNSGTLNLGGTVNLAALGSLTNHGQINIVGSLNNSGSTFTTNPAQLTWGLGNGGQISGGTIASALNVFGSAALNNLTIASTIAVQPSTALTISPNLNFSNGTLDVLGAPNTATATTLVLGDYGETGAITGTGTIKLDGGVNTTVSLQTAWTLAPGIQLSVTGGASFIGIFGSGVGGNTLVNDGGITATSSTGALAISVWNFTNAATLSATAGGTINITSSNWNNSGTISTVGGTLGLTAPWTNTGSISASTGGTINISGNILPAVLNQFQFVGSNTVNILGSLNNSGNALDSTALGASIGVVGGTINGGNVSHGLGVNNATLNNVALNSNATVTLNGPLLIAGVSSNAGTVTGTAGAITIGQTGVTSGVFTNTGSINDSAGTLSLLAGAFNSSGPVTAGNTSNISTINLLGATMQLGAVTGTGSINISGGAALVAKSINQKSLILNGTAALSVRPAGQTAASTLSVLTGLSLGTTGLLDLNNNDLMVHSANASAILSALQSGNANNAWTGATGIRSSTAAGSSLYSLGELYNANTDGVAILTTFDGTTAVAGDMLIKFTYYGDTNLDGKVDGSDYSRIDAAYVADKTDAYLYTGWYNGDFNYDGVVNGSDYTLMDNAFNTQGAALTDAIASPTAQLSVTTAVPEPTTAALLALCSLLSLGRRRRSTGMSR